MTWNSRSVRIKRIDKLLKTRNRRNIVESGGGCPTITLGDLVDSSPVFVGQDAGNTAGLISGGTGPYTATLVSGSLPAGTTLDTVFFGGEYYWLLVGTFTDFEKAIFTIGGTDSNGCAITPKEYTIKVGLITSNETPAFPNIFADVTGVTVPYTIYSVKTVAVISDLSLAQINAYDGNGDQLVLQNVGDLSGSNLNNCTWIRGNTTPMSSGTAPYSGEWSPTTVDPGGFDVTSTDNLIDPCMFQITISSPDPGDTISSVEFKLIPQ